MEGGIVGSSAERGWQMDDQVQSRLQDERRGREEDVMVSSEFTAVTWVERSRSTRQQGNDDVSRRASRQSYLPVSVGRT